MNHISKKSTSDLAFYLPLLELKILLDCAKQIYDLDPFQHANSIQKLILEFTDATPEIDLQLKEEENDFEANYSIALPYLKTKGIVSKDPAIVNDFIKANFTPYESLLLREVPNINFSLYFGLISTLKCNLFYDAHPVEYKTKHGKTINGYVFPKGDFLESDKYYGVYCSTLQGTALLFIKGKEKPVSAENYEDFLSQIDTIIFNQDYEMDYRSIPVFYPHLELELAPPKNMMSGLKSYSKRLNEPVDLKQLKMLSKIRLDQYGMTVETAATMEIPTTGIPRDKFEVDDNIFIFIVNDEGKLINAIYVDKEVFLKD